MWYIIRHLRRKRLLARQKQQGQPKTKTSPAPSMSPDTAAHCRPKASHLAVMLAEYGIPILAIGFLSLASAMPASWGYITAAAIVLLLTVLVTVHHAEIVALRAGEPFGTMVLALAVTIIEVALIISIMMSGSHEASSLARDTVYATVMIICTGGIGACLLLGAIRHVVLAFRVEGASPVLSVIIALTTLTLILPAYTTTTPGPTYSPSQLVFAGVVSLVLYGVFIFVQTVRHRDYFLPLNIEVDGMHARPPSRLITCVSLLMLGLSLIAVVGISKFIAPAIQKAVAAAGAPITVVGIAIAMMVLMPEIWAAMRAAHRNRMQTGLNLLLGSSLATIGLTIPCVVAISIHKDIPLILGLPAKETALLILTFLVSIMTLAGGRATVLHGAVHLILFATFIFLSVVP
jgi:Ca2+:H+ antiporter